MERLTEASLKWCSTYDIGRVAAKHFSDPNQFNGMTTELATWEGSVHDLASAMEEVTNQKTVATLVRLCGVDHKLKNASISVG